MINSDRLDWKIFGTLFFSMFATITGVGIVVPLLPVYAHDLGAKGIYVAMIFGAFSLSRTFFLPYFGGLSDLKGRKPFIVSGLLVYVLISIAFVFFNNVNWLIFLRLIQGIASAMIMPVVQAYVGELSPSGREGTIMGLFNTSLFAGLSIGPLIGGVLNDHLNLEAAFICMGAMALVGFLFSLIFLPPKKFERLAARSSDAAGWWSSLMDQTMASLFSFRFAYTACIGVIWGFLPVLADVQFSLSSSAIAVLIMLNVLVSGVTQVPMGYLSDRFNRKVFVVLGGLTACGAIWSFNWATGFYQLFIASMVFGIGGGTAMPALMAMGVQHGNKINAMGTAMALLTMAHSLGMLVGSLLAGIMMDYFELKSAFSLGAAVMFLGVLCFIFLASGPLPIKKKTTRQTAIKVDS